MYEIFTFESDFIQKQISIYFINSLRRTRDYNIRFALCQQLDLRLWDPYSFTAFNPTLLRHRVSVPSVCNFDSCWPSQIKFLSWSVEHLGVRPLGLRPSTLPLMIQPLCDSWSSDVVEWQPQYSLLRRTDPSVTQRVQSVNSVLVHASAPLGGNWNNVCSENFELCLNRDDGMVTQWMKEYWLAWTTWSIVGRIWKNISDKDVPRKKAKRSDMC